MFTWLKTRAPLKVGNPERAQGVRLPPVGSGFPEGVSRDAWLRNLQMACMLAVVRWKNICWGHMKAWGFAFDLLFLFLFYLLFTFVIWQGLDLHTFLSRCWVLWSRLCLPGLPRLPLKGLSFRWYKRKSHKADQRMPFVLHCNLLWDFLTLCPSILSQVVSWGKKQACSRV